MKIQGRKPQQIGSMGPLGMPAPAEPAPRLEEPQAVGDQVDISSTGQVRELRQMVEAMPAVRTEKLGGLRDAIEDGSYYVESDKLARRVVNETLTEALLARE